MSCEKEMNESERVILKEMDEELDEIQHVLFQKSNVDLFNIVKRNISNEMQPKLLSIRKKVARLIQ